MEVAEHVAERLSQMKFFEEISRKPDNPMIVITVSSAHTQRWTLRDLQSGLKQYGWSVAVYDLPGQSKRCTVMRIAIRQGVGGSRWPICCLTISKQWRQASENYNICL